MARKKTPGLVKRSGLWHIDKRINGRRVCHSTGSNQLEEAERYLARLTEQARQASIYGVRPKRTFEEAAAKFVLENQHKRSLHFGSAKTMASPKASTPRWRCFPDELMGSGILRITG